MKPLNQAFSGHGHLLTGCCWWLLLLAVGLMYWQGLQAGILFDDSPSLDTLPRIHGHDFWYESLQYSLNGISSRLGRPLSLFTFALQHHSWPGSIADFLCVNVLIHLLNGTLLFWAMWRLEILRTGGVVPPSPTMPAMVAALWLILPLHISTTLYVVQRMTLLAGTCVFGGLTLYLYGRSAANQGRRFIAIGAMSAGVFIGTIVGTLAKENAALFPLLLLILEYSLLQSITKPSFFRWWQAAALWAPTALLLGYLALSLSSLLRVYTSFRDFTLAERLLTETRVLFVYLKTMLIPGLGTGRIYFDDVELSRSLLHPATTLMATTAWIVLLFAALRWRTRWPYLSFAILWYLSSHLLESTVLPLEIGFEHRNYIPAVGPMLALAFGLRQLMRDERFARARMPLAVFAFLYPAYLGFAGWQSIKLWNQPLERAAYWYYTQPGSARAAHTYAEQLALSGQFGEAIHVYKTAEQRWPRDLSFFSAQLTLGCVLPQLAIPPPEELGRRVGTSETSVLSLLNGVLNLIELRERKYCSRYSDASILGYMEALSSPRVYENFESSVLSLQARLAAASENMGLAADRMYQAAQMSELIPAFQDALNYALQANKLELAEQILAHAENDARVPWLHRWTYRREILGMRQLYRIYSAPLEPTASDASAVNETSKL